jgi:hypothetical protein
LRHGEEEIVSATDAEPGTAPAVLAERVAAVEAAAHRWASQLVDLTGRNNLLYFRDLKVGTMDLATAPEDALFDVLAGRPVRLKRLVPDPNDRLLAARRARTVHNRAQEHFEERGLETLFLACGMATWTSQRSSATPAAPARRRHARWTRTPSGRGCVRPE